jgi:hypothetical protein
MRLRPTSNYNYLDQTLSLLSIVPWPVPHSPSRLFHCPLRDRSDTETNGLQRWPVPSGEVLRSLPPNSVSACINEGLLRSSVFSALHAPLLRW